MANKTAGETIFAETFRDESRDIAGDVPMTKSDGKIDKSFLPANLAWDEASNYALDDIVGYKRSMWASNIDDNLNNPPSTTGEGNISQARLKALSIVSQEANAYAMAWKSDGMSFYIVGNNKIVYRYDCTTAWDSTTAEYSGDSFNYSASANYAGYDIKFKPDGTKMYLVTSYRYIYQWDLSTAWDITTASYVGSLYTYSQQRNPWGMLFNDDGTKVYLIGTYNDNIQEYNLTTAWEITASTVGSTANYNTVDNDFRNMWFNDDGTKLFMLGQQFDQVYQFTLSTAYDPLTATLETAWYWYQYTTGSYAFTFNSAGTKIYITDYTNDLIQEFDLATAFDLSTIRFIDEFVDVNGQESGVQDVAFNNDGTKMFITGTGADSVFSYNLSTAYDVSTATYVGTFLSVSTQVANPYGLTFSTDGTKMYVVSTTDIVYQYTLSTAWDLSTGSYSSKSFSVATEEANTRCVRFSADGTKMYIIGTTGYTFFQYTLSTAWDVTTASYASKSKGVATAMSIAFSPDGLKAVIMLTSRRVAYATLGTAWDISTMTVRGEANTDVDLNTYGGITFNGDGTKFCVADGSLNDIVAFGLSTGYTLTTPSSNFSFFSVSAQDTSPQGIWFKPDGTKCYIGGSTNDRIYQYNFTVPFDLTTASYHGFKAMGSLPANPRTAQFNDDGTIMYVMTNNTTYVYECSTAWDVTTAVYNASLNKLWTDFPEVTANVSWITFNDEGDRVYLGSTTDYKILTFILTTPWDITTAIYSGKELDVNGIGSNAPYAFFMSPNGGKAFLLQTDQIVYEMKGTGYDISTFYYTGNSFDTVIDGNIIPYFTPDGNKMFTVYTSKDNIYEYVIDNGLYGKWTKITN